MTGHVPETYEAYGALAELIRCLGEFFGPAAGPYPAVGARDVASLVQHEGYSLLGDGWSVAALEVHDRDPTLARGLHVHVLDPSASYYHSFQIRPGIEHRLRDRGEVNRNHFGVADGLDDLLRDVYGLRAVLLHDLLDVVLVLSSLLAPRHLPHRPEVLSHLLLDGLAEPLRGEEKIAHAKHFHGATSSRGRRARPRGERQPFAPGRRLARRSS